MESVIIATMENISAKYPLGISKISNIKVNVSDLQNGGWYEDVNYANHWCAEPFVWIVVKSYKTTSISDVNKSFP